MKACSTIFSKKGFTLIEMAVVIIIVGIVISTMVTVLPSLLQTAKRKEAKALLEKYDYALQGYVIANNRLPFADTNGDGTEDAGFVGTLPYITIGLSSGNDAWGNPVRYAVFGEVAGTANLTDTDSTTFCTAISAADVLAFNANIVYTTTDSGGCTANVTNASNQAYVIASGGTKDLGGTPGFFDGCNGTGVGFNSVNTMISPTYDDIIKGLSFGELNRIICTGGGSGGSGGGSGGSSGVENTDALCSDNIDNDGDGKTDCFDQDCCDASITVCPGGCPPLDAVDIDTDPIPNPQSGDTSFSHTFQAAGGSGNYFWYLNSITPAISGLAMDLWSGNLSGTISSCAGTYSIEVRVEDRNDGTLTDVETFALEVEASQIRIIPEPASSPDYTVNASLFETFFQVNELDGGHVGDYTWTINWQTSDPGGFQINPTSEGARDIATNAKLWKSGTVTGGAGIYTFNLTITDDACPGNTFTSNSYSMEITASGINPPYTESMVGEWRFDECAVWDGASYDVVDTLNTQGDLRYNGRANGGGVQSHAGKLCKAAYFAGGDDKIVSNVLTGPEIMVFTGEVTLACWFKSPGGGGAYPRLIEFADASGASNTSTCLAYDSDGSLRAWVTSESGVRGGSVDYSATRYNDNQWHHAVYTYGPSGAKLYVDGELKTTSNNNPTTDIHDAETFAIGGYYPNNSHGYVGFIDEVMIFQREFALAEIEDLFALTRLCTDTCYSEPLADYQMEQFPWDGTADEVQDSGSSGSNGLAALRGTGALPTQTMPSLGKVCRSGVFTRVNSTNGGYLDFGDPADGDLDPGTSAWTISSWINWDGSTGENIIHNKENLYEARVANGYVQYAWRPYWAWTGGNTFPITQDTWAYVTIVYDGINQTLYKDGQQVYTRAQTGSMGQNTSKFLIGARGNNTPRNFFGGMIDEVKIYDRALAKNEIITDMNSTRDCSIDSVIISSTALANGTISSVYTTAISASGGTAPYAWTIVTNPFAGLTLDSFSGSNVNFTGAIGAECSGDYNVTLKVTDDNTSVDQRTFTLTVNNGTLSIVPVAGQTFNCTATTFTQDFTISGPRVGVMENWTINWQGTNPGGLEIVSTGADTGQIRKNGASTIGNGYLFSISARDATCTDNTYTSGNYFLNIDAGGAPVP